MSNLTNSKGLATIFFFFRIRGFGCIITLIRVDRLSLSHVAAEEEVERRNGGGEQESERRDAFMPRRENQGRAFARALPDEASTCLTLRLYIHSTRSRTPTVPLFPPLAPKMFSSLRATSSRLGRQVFPFASSKSQH